MYYNVKTSLIALVSAFTFGSLQAQETFLRISELRIDEPGTDVNEFFELEGSPSLLLNDIWYLVIGDHSNFGSGASEMPNYRSGVVEFAIDLSGLSIGSSGFFTVATTTMNITPRNVDLVLPAGALIFENTDNVTHVLVRGYKGIEVLDPSDQLGVKAVNLDPLNNGVLVDPLPWDETIDAIGLVKLPNALVDPETSQEEFTYGAALGFVDIGPDGTFVPGHVYRGANDGEWNIGTFTLSSLDTPGIVNPNSPVEPVISRFTPKTVVRGETYDLSGRNFNSVTSVMIGAEAVSFEVISNNLLRYTVPEFAISGPLTIVNSEGTLVTNDQIRVLQNNQSILAYEDFAYDFGDLIAISMASNRNWTWGQTLQGSGYAEMNGFGSSVDGASDDWLISAPINLADTTSPILEYVTSRNFNGPDLEVLISTDFSGFNPTTATWVPAGGTLSATGFAVADSGPVSLNDYKGQSIRVAFRYTSEGNASGQAATIRVHEFVIRDTTESGFQPGWVETDSLGQFYLLSNTWGYSEIFGFVYIRYEGWMYLSELGWVAVGPGSVESGLWLQSMVLGWIWTSSNLDGRYISSDGEVGEFQSAM